MTEKLPGQTDSIVTEARERFGRAKDAYADNRVLAIADTQFVLGDSDNKWQWDPIVWNARMVPGAQRPCLTVNVTAQHLNQVQNNIRQNRPQCRVLPADSKADKKTAEIIAGVIRNIQVSSHADVAHDTASWHAGAGGEGYWRILTDYESPTSFDQVITIASVENPQLVYIDPFCGMDKLKAEWGFVFEDITKEQCKRNWPECDPQSWSVDTEGGWVAEHTVRIADYYYCVNEKDTLIMLGDGTTMYESAIKKEGGPEAAEMAKAQAQAMEAAGHGRKMREVLRPQWKYCKLIGGHDKPVDERDWPGSYLPIIQVVGVEVNVNGKIVRKGLVRDLKDPARMVNYAYSGAVETIGLQNKIPYIAAAEAIEGYEKEWAGANQSTASYLPYNAVDGEGNPIPKPERQQPAVMPQAQISLLQLSLEQMRAASGQNNASFGIKSEASSGVGIQRLKVQGETATFHFPDNLARALHDEAVVLIDLICCGKVLDTARVMRILGVDGKEDKVRLEPALPASYTEITEADVKRIFNPTLGRYDVVIDTGPSYQTQRQEGAAAMTELASKNPALLQIAGDIIMKAYDFPFSEQLAERLKKTLPPELQDEAEGEIPPEVRAQMDAMQKQIEQLAGALEAAGVEMKKLQDESVSKFNESLIRAYDAETKRISALGGAMGPEAVQALVMQTLQEVLGSPGPDPIPPDPGPPQGPQIPEEPVPPAGFSLPAPGMDTPPAMAATGANPGPGLAPVLPEGMQ
jgi:hypothetical protein